jgi:hypothetical protein
MSFPMSFFMKFLQLSFVNNLMLIIDHCFIMSSPSDVKLEPTACRCFFMSMKSGLFLQAGNFVSLHLLLWRLLGILSSRKIFSELCFLFLIIFVKFKT